MLKLLGRLWAGFVGAVAGASLGLVAAMVLVMLNTSLDIALWTVAGLAILGGVVAFALGNSGSSGK